jgi:hypothetical protein
MNTENTRLLLVASLAAAVGGTALLLLGGTMALSRHSALQAQHAASVALAAGKPPKPAAASRLFEPFDVRPSAWAQREAQLFSRVLAGVGCEVLVVPFEARGASVDRPGRSLMARLLAARIATQSGTCVVDPTLAARALGAARRGYDWPAIAALADAAGATVVLRGEVALNHPADSFDVQLKQWRRRPNGQGWDESPLPAMAPIAFHDELPPEEAFAARVPDVTAALDLPGARPGGAAAPKRSMAAAPDIPADPRALATGDGPPVARAQHLQWLAALLSPAREAADHLWERSLVALAQSDGGDERVAVLRARAFFHLHRRPYAVKLLEGRQSPEARALRAVLDGNLADAQARAAALDPPREALMAAVDAQALGMSYGSWKAPPEQLALHSALLARYRQYAPLVMPALADEYWDWEGAHLLIARDLDRDGSLDAAGTAALRRALRATPGNDPREIAMRLGLQVESSYAPVWERHAASWRAARAFDRLAPWDHTDALHAMNRAMVAKTVLRNRTLDSLEAVANAQRLLPAEFTDYAPVATQLAQAEGEIWRSEGISPATDTARADFVQRVRALYAWEGGETRISEDLDLLLSDPPKHLYQDEPMRPWRSPESNPADRFDGTRLDLRRANSHAAHYLRAARYTHEQFWYLERAFDYLSSAGRKDEARRLVDENRERFVGNYLRDLFLAKLARVAGDAPAEAALLAAAIRARPDLSSNYEALAVAQLRQHAPAEAQRTLLSQPTLAGRAETPCETADQGYAAGMILVDVGELELARPLLEMSSRAAADVCWNKLSTIRLAMEHGDYREALALSERLVSDHGYTDALTETAMMHFLLGDADAGWKAFHSLWQRSKDARPFSVAFAGHRIAGSSDTQILQFASQWTLPNLDQFTAMCREYFLFNLLMIDRPPSADTLRMALTFQGQSGDRAMPLLANGYFAFRNGNHAAAIENFKQLHEALRNLGVHHQRSVNYALPYMAASLLELGRAEEAVALVSGERDRGSTGFHTLVAQAFVAGWAGDVAKARDSLWSAFVVRPSDPDLAVKSSFQILEAAELLFARTKDTAYRDALIDLSRRSTRAWPDSWAFALLARHTQDPEERLHALGIALFLDPRSEHLAAFGASERAEAAKWFALNNPFSGARERIKAAMLAPLPPGRGMPRAVASAAALTNRPLPGG